MAASSSTTSEARLFLRASLRGCAQLAFCDSPLAGLLVLAGITLASPFAGFGAAAGAVFGTVAGRFIPAYAREEWEWGLAGFNPAIVGLLCAGFIASWEVGPGVLIAALGSSVLLDLALRRLLGHFMLPSLSTGALATLYIGSLTLASPGAWYWTDAAANPLIPFGLLGAACILAAMGLKSPFAAAWALLLGAIAYLACWLFGNDARAWVGLWGMTVPLASFGVHAIFLRGSLAGGVAGAIAALLGALIWVAWEVSPLGRWLPPLLTPFILGVWSSIVLMRKLMAAPLAQPNLWRIGRLLATARAMDAEVVALIQRGTGLEAPVSGFIGGSWLDPRTPRSAFERERLHMSSRSRQAFWDAADRLRAGAVRMTAGSAFVRVARLQRDGWVRAVLIQDAMLPATIMPPNALVALHGDVERTECLDCGARSPWPPMPVWRRCDLRCAACQGPVVPAFTPFGGEIETATLNRVREIATRCAVVLVLGDEAREPATLDFLDRARQAGAVVVFVADGTPAYPRRPADISIAEPVERFLASLSLVLAVWRFMPGYWSRQTRSTAAAMAAPKRGREGAA